MRLGKTTTPLQNAGAPRPKRDAGLSLIEILICAAILMIFAGSAIVGMTVLNNMSISTRNQTQARVFITQKINQMLSVQVRSWAGSPWNGVDLVEPVNIAEHTKDGQLSTVPGTMTTSVTADPGGNDTRRVTVTLAYTFRGRPVELKTSTIRGLDGKSD